MSTLVYDGDCPFCTRVAGWARRRLPPRHQVVAYQEADLEALGLTREQAARAAWWVDGRGRRRPGHRAVAAALRAIGGLWGLAGEAIEAPGLDRVSEWAYEVVSRNRRHLSRLVGARRGNPSSRAPEA